MKLWIQRVLSASVDVGDERLSEIGRGFLILLGVGRGDTPETADRLAKRAVALRIFEDAEGKTNLSVADVGGSVIVVSQFTLYADTKHGNRPGFSPAAPPEVAEPIYERFVARMRELLGPDRVGTGRFGAEMKVSLVNDGPFSVEVAE
ncbi:MAG: D-tyrosyl-tRNA(Tyr) deacylase [Kiritimatiellae bacterium]|nr:D-tyrosyl-tRNA(Tyr) deacylase [Kiritimatiellia bacterium]